MPARYLEFVRDIAGTLAREAIPTRDGLIWESDDLLGEDEATCTVVHGPVGPGLYSGIAGIAWFLAHAAAYDDSHGVGDTALRALCPVLAQTKAGIDSADLSLMSGATGIAWVAWDVGERLDRPELRRSGASLARDIASLVRERAQALPLDLVSGLAGIVLGLLALHRRSPDARILEACHDACESMVRRGRRDWYGLAWPERNARGVGPGLCGLAHGASGMALALAETAFVSGDRQWLDAVSEALRYERSWFSAEYGGWPDLRDASGATERLKAAPSRMIAWCHGALGIGLTRLRLYEQTHDLQALADIGAAVNAARTLVMEAAAGLQAGQATDVTLCHGLAGAAELLLVAYEVLGEDEHLRAAKRVGELCIGSFEANGRRWPCGLRRCGVLPGLFLGAAGVGATFLRLHDQRACSSVALPGISLGPAQSVLRQASASA